MTATTTTARRAAAQVAEAITCGGYRFADERQLQNGIYVALTDYAALATTAEYSLGPRERVDFLVETGGLRIAVEVKCRRGHRPADVLRQLQRYAAHDDVDALVLATTIPDHRTLPDEVGGKPLAIALIRGAL